MADLQALKTELDTDPEGRGYVDMTDEQAADDLMEKRYIGEKRATYLTIAAELGDATARSLIDALDSAEASDKLVREALHRIRQSDGVNLGDPVTRGLLDQFVTNDLLTSEEAAAIKGLAENLLNRAEQLGIGTVRPGTVQMARNL